MADQIPDSAKSRAAFALAVSKIDRDVRLSDLTDAEIDALIASTRAAPPAMDREAVAAIIDHAAFDPAVEADSTYPIAMRRLQLRRKEALDKADAILSTLSADAIRQGEGDMLALKRRADREEAAHLLTIGQRDAAEAALSDAYRVVCGREPAWSNNFSYEDAVSEMRDAATPAPAVDAVPAGEVDALRVDWNRRELADAYDMVEGMRQQIAQPAESPLNQSLLTVMDALEAADVEWSGITKTDRSSEA